MYLLCSYLSICEMLEACRRNLQRCGLSSFNNTHLKEEYSILFEKVKIKVKAKDDFDAASKYFAQFSCQVHLLSSISNSCTCKYVSSKLFYTQI